MKSKTDNMQPMKKKIKKIVLWILDLSINAAIIVILVIGIQNWIVAPFDVSGSSMCPTLNEIDDECINNEGEKIIINAAALVFGEPQRGDIVVFKSPSEDGKKYFIKRIIGQPSDKVEIEDGDVFINGQKIKENYLSEKNKGNTKTYFTDLNVFEVPEDHYFVLGDNRGASTDSRSCFQTTVSISCKENPERAFVHKDLIAGKAALVWWPINSMRLLEKTKYPELEE